VSNLLERIIFKAIVYRKLLLAVFIFLFLVLIGYAFWHPISKLITSATTPTAAIIAPMEDIPAADQNQTKTIAIQRFDTLSRIFQKQAIDPQIAKSMLALKETRKILSHLQPGKNIQLTLDNQQKVLQLSYQVDDLTTLIVTNKGNGFVEHINKIEPTARLDYIAAPIQGSIYASAQKVGMSKKIVNKIISLFGDKVNFRKNLNGAHLVALVRDFYVGDKKLNNSELAALEFIHKDKDYRLIAFTDANGETEFYTPEGYSLKSPFARYPLKFRAITSRFSLHRLHPIYHTVCAHLGVDFSAPMGTPVKATSSGRIVFSGIKTNYGKVVIVQHNQYSTLYAHLSRLNTRAGSYVKEGQVIGYLGSTGLSTGPHLHYEFRINGVHYDPLSVKLPKGEMIASNYRKKFLSLAHVILGELNLHHDLLASNLTNR
jgi:murein DD-endopeptidase MepM/ murein hydrolase activator NlpD